MNLLLNLPAHILRRIALYLSMLDVCLFAQTCQYTYTSLPKVVRTFAVKDAVTSPERFDFVYNMLNFPQKELKRFLLAAAVCNNLPVVQRFYEKYKFSQPQNVLVHAVRNNHLDTVRWLLATYRVDGEGEYQHYSRTSVSLDTEIAQLARSIEMLQLLRANGLRWNFRTTFAAARNRDAVLLAWAVKNGCPWDPRLCFEEAAFARDLDQLAWLLDNGWTPMQSGNYICLFFASNGYLPELQWTYERGFPLDPVPCTETSIFHQNLPMLQWLLLEVGCPWNPIYTQYALDRPNNEAMVTWMRTTTFLKIIRST